MKLLTIIAVTLMSFSMFANSTCTNVELKNNVSSCYSVTSTQPGKFVTHQVTKYILEYSCDYVLYTPVRARDRFSSGGKYQSTSIASVPKRIEVKKRFRTLEYCKEVADHLETNDSYPGLLDQAKYFFID